MATPSSMELFRSLNVSGISFEFFIQCRTTNIVTYPYFPNDGLTKICSRESKGLFIDICSIYWSRLGELPYALALQKLCNGKEDALQELKKADIFGVIEGQIVIEFLDEQLSERGQVSEKRRNAAKKRWSDASALQVESKSNAKRIEENIKEEKREEDNSLFVWPSFLDFWDRYDKKQDRPKCKKKWDKINQEAREKIMLHLEDYILSTPDKQYRKNPLTYLNSESWENEIITPNTNGKFTREEKVNSLRAAFAKQVIERGKGT